MNFLKNKLQWFCRNSFYLVFFLITIGFIYVLFPKQGINKLEFQRGNPWLHQNLIAPFDFPILKPKEVIASERDSIKREFIPYLVFDSTTAQQQLAIFENEFKKLYESGELIASAPEYEQAETAIKTILLECFTNGIIDNTDKSDFQQLLKEHVYYLENNVATLKNTKDILTLKSAYVTLDDKLSAAITSKPLLLKIQQSVNLAKYLDANLNYDQKINEKMLNEILASHSITRGVVQAGERIIMEGDIVNNQNYILLESLQQAYKKNRFYGGWISAMIIGKMVLVVALLLVLIFYLEIFNRDLLWKKRNFALIFSNILITFILARLIYNSQTISFYVIPVCILPIIIRTFMGIRLAVFIHLITMLLIGFLAPNSFEFVFIQLIAGTMAIMSLSRLHRRGHLILTSLAVMVTYFILFISFELIKEGSIRLIDWPQIRWFALSGFLILIAYPLIFIYEKAFGFVSDVTLMELSDTNHPLLRRLAEEAPGTFQHSLQVANLAEAVIVRTGGNAMLVRTGALYHDVGKLVNPHFFIENQMGGTNPHETITNYESASIIINHVSEGLKMAKKYKIPDTIVDFIKMHHGKSLTRYFYLKQKDENKGVVVDVERFMYPGPNPYTRETAVLMLADGVEAATRSLSDKNEQTLKQVVDQIIDFKVNNHELDDAPITFKDIREIKEIFLRKLINIYHIRIQYPVIDYSENP
jgi:putative nucleotidyltransferase with HDIG domain